MRRSRDDAVEHAVLAESAGADAARPRVELVRRRALQGGWGCVVLGLLIPVIALRGVYVGVTWRRNDGGGQLALIATGAVVFVGRLALWIAGVV